MESYVLIDVEDDNIEVLEVIITDDYKKALKRQECYSEVYDNVHLYSGIKVLKEEGSFNMEKKSFLEKVGEMNPWNVFWIMFFGVEVIGMVCEMVVGVANAIAG